MSVDVEGSGSGIRVISLRGEEHSKVSAVHLFMVSENDEREEHKTRIPAKKHSAVPSHTYS